MKMNHFAYSATSSLFRATLSFIYASYNWAYKVCLFLGRLSWKSLSSIVKPSGSLVQLTDATDTSHFALDSSSNSTTTHSTNGPYQILPHCLYSPLLPYFLSNFATAVNYGG